MRIVTALAAALAAAAVSASPAHAGDPSGKVQLKLLGTGVLPDGGLKRVEFATPAVAAALPANADTETDDNYVPTIAAEYFFSPNFSLETICCVTQHDVVGTDGLAGAELVDDATIIPATLTLKYHLPTASGFKPYIGAGPTYWLIFDEKPGATAQALGATSTEIDDQLGFVLQAGFDVALGDDGFGLTVDAKRYFIDRNATWYDATGARILETEHDLDPWVLSAGVAFRF